VELSLPILFLVFPAIPEPETNKVSHFSGETLAE
jgi:hypothetical protein